MVEKFDSNKMYKHGDRAIVEGLILTYCDSCNDWFIKGLIGECPRCGKEWKNCKKSVDKES